MTSITIFIICLICFGTGIGLGAFLFQQFSPEQKKAREIVKHLHEKQDEFKNYQFEVSQYFIEHSQLLNLLSESYRNLHNHSADAVQKLGAQNPLTPIIQSIKDPENLSSSLKLDISTAIPPLDYAPKHTPYDRGMLNEEYGLEKVELNEKLNVDFGKSLKTS